MTYRERLTMMNGYQLILEAEKHNVKVPHKGRALKISKDKAIAKILAVVEEKPAEVEEKPAEVPTVEEEPTVEEAPAEVPEVQTVEEAPAEVEAPAPKKERKPRKKKELTTDVKNLLQFIKDAWTVAGGTVREPEKENAVFNALCAEGGRQVLKLMWTTKKISLFTRVETATQFAEKYQKINYGLPYQCMFFADTEQNRDNLQKLFAHVLAIDAVRPKKEKKAKAKKKAEPTPAEVETA